MAVMQRWQPQGSTMISIPNGLYVLASEAEEWKRRAERAERYVAGEDLRSDFATAAEMRAALDALTRRLALAVAEVKAWRHRPTSFTNPQSTFTVADAEAVWGAIVRAKQATDADPLLRKMIGGGE